MDVLTRQTFGRSLTNRALVPIRLAVALAASASGTLKVLGVGTEPLTSLGCGPNSVMALGVAQCLVSGGLLYSKTIRSAATGSALLFGLGTWALFVDGFPTALVPAVFTLLSVIIGVWPEATVRETPDAPIDTEMGTGEAPVKARSIQRRAGQISEQSPPPTDDMTTGEWGEALLSTAERDPSAFD